MNAANITHGLKLAGGNTRMWVGVLVIAVVLAIAFQLLAQEQKRRQIERGLFG
jgi:hypothetical protein